jgi:hypothetical protein
MVSIREVGPRDGFQNEPEVIATADKVRLIDQLARTGLRRLEVTSFVRADVIPQLADAPEVLAAIDPPDGVSLSVLIPNERGLDAALRQRDRFHEVNVFLSASETHNRRTSTARSSSRSAGSSACWAARAPRAALRGRDLGRLRLPLRGPRAARARVRDRAAADRGRARRRSASATRPGWPTRRRCADSSRRRARRSAMRSS